MRVELKDEARDDLVDGAVFYGEQSTGLDEYFLVCLRADLTKLRTTFGIHAQYRGFHRSLSERFPFESITWLPRISLMSLFAHAVASEHSRVRTGSRRSGVAPRSMYPTSPLRYSRDRSLYVPTQKGTNSCQRST